VRDSTIKERRTGHNAKDIAQLGSEEEVIIKKNLKALQLGGTHGKDQTWVRVDAEVHFLAGKMEVSEKGNLQDTMGTLSTGKTVLRKNSLGNNDYGGGGGRIGA